MKEEHASVPYKRGFLYLIAIIAALTVILAVAVGRGPIDSIGLSWFHNWRYLHILRLINAAMYYTACVSSSFCLPPLSLS